jgi:hypothetical protein
MSTVDKACGISTFSTAVAVNAQSPRFLPSPTPLLSQQWTSTHTDKSLPTEGNTATELGMASEILPLLDKDQAHPEPSQLCFNCQNIIDHWPDDSDPQRTRRRFSHYGSESALIASADHGCSLCRQFALGYNCKTWSNWHWDEGEEPGPGEGRVELDSGRTLRSIHYRDCYWWIHLFIPASPYNARSGSHNPKTEEEYLQYEVAAAPVAASGKLNFSLNPGFKSHYLLQILPNFSMIA